SRKGTARLSHLEAEPLREAVAWLGEYREYWEESYERLHESLRATQERRRGGATSGGGSTRRGGRPEPTREGVRHDRAEGHRGAEVTRGPHRARDRRAARPRVPSVQGAGVARAVARTAQVREGGRHVRVPRRWALAVPPQGRAGQHVRVPRRLPR